MPAPVEHIAFDQLFVAYNRMRRDVDIKLKPLGLTLTSLQILMAIHALQAHPQQCNRAAVAARVGITNSTASIMIGGLIRRGLVVETKNGYDLKRKPLALSSKRVHQDVYHGGLTEWDSVLDQWHDALPATARKRFFDAIEAANVAMARTDAAIREDRYLKSLKRHSTRANVFRTKGTIG
jgi:DNA-binding MarR family transcriptional regulator